MRLFITGPSQAGKSFTARIIAEALDTTIISMDNIRQQTGDFRERKAIVRTALDQSDWIFEGRCPEIGFLPIERADIILFIDPPKIYSAFRALKRISFYLKQHPSRAKRITKIVKNHLNNESLAWRQIIDPNNTELVCGKLLQMRRRKDVNKFIQMASIVDTSATCLLKQFIKFQPIEARYSQ